MSQPIVAANWKLNKGPEESRSFISEFKKLVKKEEEGQFCIFPPAYNWGVFSSELVDTSVIWGAQNIYEKSSGAFTGENSASVLKEMGGSAALIGHSERRQIFGEDDELLANKVEHAVESGLLPILCVGETLDERDAGKTEEVVLKQVVAGLSKISDQVTVVIAYEPVWAIGTGKVATPEQAGDVHKAIREKLYELRADMADETPILYGGSVKPENSKELFQQDEIDGFLVGGASLKADSFYGIYTACK